MANFIERMGVAYCMKKAAELNWIFREQPVDDIGIDAHMEVTDNKGRVKQLLALQIKSGASYFKENRGEYIIFRDIDDRQYNYWTTNTLPCIVVLFNPLNEMCVWQKLTIETIQKTSKGNGKGYFINIPTNQKFLDSISNKLLLTYTSLPEHITNYNFLLSQKKIMQILQEGGLVKLHSKEWVNKTSGRGKIEIIVDDGTNTDTYSYPYWFPYTQYTDVFPRLFPWAEFDVDEDYYKEYDTSLWHELHCYYDSEKDKWIEVGYSFEEFRNSLDSMRSIDYEGEVAEYMFVLSLNELGKSFLNVNNYVTKPHPYASVRSAEYE